MCRLLRRLALSALLGSTVIVPLHAELSEVEKAIEQQMMATMPPAIAGAWRAYQALDKSAAEEAVRQVSRASAVGENIGQATIKVFAPALKDLFTRLGAAANLLTEDGADRFITQTLSWLEPLQREYAQVCDTHRSDEFSNRLRALRIPDNDPGAYNQARLRTPLVIIDVLVAAQKGGGAPMTSQSRP